MRTPRGAAEIALARREMTGRKVYLWGHKGTIADVTSTPNGYGRFVIEWENPDDVPDYWTDTVAPGCEGLYVRGIDVPQLPGQ